MTLAALARKADVSAQSLTAYENHRKSPSAETLSSLSTALRFPVSFFHADPAPDMHPGAVSFRAPSKMSAVERDSALSSGAIAATLNSWLESKFSLPKPDVPSLAELGPEQAAEHVRGLWGLGEATAPNMVHLLEAHGVRVFSLAPDCLDVDAFSTTRHGTPYVFLNTRKTGERGRFDAAHELGHLVLHSGYQSPRGPEAEAAADHFASAFLMPRAGILAQQLSNASVDRILSAKRRWKVSAMALAYRLRTMQLLSEWRFHQAAKQLAQMGYRKGEPNSDLVRENSLLLAKVFEALRGIGMTPAEIAAEMNIEPEELNHYVFGLIPVGFQGGGKLTAPARPALRVVT